MPQLELPADDEGDPVYKADKFNQAKGGPLKRR